jgi:nitrate/nitrite-specific signal transduction histidine kinase
MHCNKSLNFGKAAVMESRATITRSKHDRLAVMESRATITRSKHDRFQNSIPYLPSITIQPSFLKVDVMSTTFPFELVCEFAFTYAPSDQGRAD